MSQSKSENIWKLESGNNYKTLNLIGYFLLYFLDISSQDLNIWIIAEVSSMP